MSFQILILEILTCIGISYFFMRGLLGVLYEIADWTVKKLDSSD